jgi:hypothetical protein
MHSQLISTQSNPGKTQVDALLFHLGLHNIHADNLLTNRTLPLPATLVCHEYAYKV